MSVVAKDIVDPITTSLSQSSSIVQDIELEVPADFGDLAWEFALKLQNPGGESFESLLQGSGTQAYLMYLLLNLVDNSYHRTFGWRQAVIWALEEPESYLHSDLQVRVADFLRERAEQPRLQVLMSTHNPIFMATGESGFLIDTDSGASTATMLPSRELVTRGVAGGVSPFVHPLVMGVPRPLLLVEGRSDAEYLYSTYRSISRVAPWEIRSLDMLDPTVGGSGVEHIIKYLQSNRQAIAARPLSAPIVVLLDWEVPDNKVKDCGNTLSGHASSRVLRMPLDQANPDLDSSFKGIERFLPTDVWQAVAKEPGVRLQRPSDGDLPLSITNQAMKAAKPHLRKTIAARDDPQDLKYLAEVVNWLEACIGASQETELPS